MIIYFFKLDFSELIELHNRRLVKYNGLEVAILLSRDFHNRPITIVTVNYDLYIFRLCVNAAQRFTP